MKRYRQRKICKMCRSWWERSDAEQKNCLPFPFRFLTSHDLITTAREPARPLRSRVMKLLLSSKSRVWWFNCKGEQQGGKEGERRSKWKTGKSEKEGYGGRRRVMREPLSRRQSCGEPELISICVPPCMAACSHEHTHTKQAHIQQTKAPGHFRSWYLTPWVSFKAWKEVVWTSCDIYPSSVCPVIPTLKDWATGLHGGR